MLGNPPFLSQLAASTTRGGSSRHGGGPYADAAAEFLALAVRLARPGAGRVGLVLPQSILASRDAAGVRSDVDRRAELIWSWWSPRRVFDAQVFVCALAFEVGAAGVNGHRHRPWSRVVTDALGVPALPPLATAGTLGGRGRLSANFRDQYYGLVPAVDDHATGPPLVTSGLIDPGRCRWGERAVTFARRRLARPRVDRTRLSPPMRRWADRFAVPKVLVANQTRIIEAVADPEGAWLPGVPLITVRARRARRRLGDRRRPHVGAGECLGVAPRRRHRAVGGHAAPGPAVAGRPAVARRVGRPCGRGAARRRRRGVWGGGRRRLRDRRRRRRRLGELVARPAPVIELAVVAVLGLGAVSCGGDDGSPGSATDEGREISQRAGCTACHGAEGEGGIGPAWAGSLGSEIELDDGTTVTVDEAYLERAITDPAAEIHAGFSVTMPENQLTDEEVAQVIDYIVSLDS